MDSRIGKADQTVTVKSFCKFTLYLCELTVTTVQLCSETLFISFLSKKKKVHIYGRYVSICTYVLLICKYSDFLKLRVLLKRIQCKASCEMVCNTVL